MSRCCCLNADYIHNLRHTYTFKGMLESLDP